MRPTDPMTTEECWVMLRGHVLGRVAFTESALPTIAPVRYEVQEGRLVLHCPNERMADLLDRQVIALEVDDTIARRAECTSVVVTGTAERLGGFADGDRTSERLTVRLHPGRVRGQRLPRAA
jgi:nitroimidazol reductase NimA-like FMN-containing flavoprotein (pyridoxamine 5'-phosphate oxidase superfamily)